MTKIKNIHNINNIYQKSKQLNTLQDKFEILDQLNIILKEIIPSNLSNHCHIGAVDETKNLLILFITNSASANLIKNQVNRILQSCSKYGFIFDGIITRITIKTDSANPIRYRKLNPRDKSQLEKLAIAIGKPELIIDNDEEDQPIIREIEF